MNLITLTGTFTVLEDGLFIPNMVTNEYQGGCERTLLLSDTFVRILKSVVKIKYLSCFIWKTLLNLEAVKEIQGTHIDIKGYQTAEKEINYCLNNFLSRNCIVACDNDEQMIMIIINNMNTKLYLFHSPEKVVFGLNIVAIKRFPTLFVY